MLQDYSSLFAIIHSTIACSQLYLMICHNMVCSGSMIFITKSPSYFTLLYKQFIWGPSKLIAYRGARYRSIVSNLLSKNDWFGENYLLSLLKKKLLGSNWSCVGHCNSVVLIHWECNKIPSRISQLKNVQPPFKHFTLDLSMKEMDDFVPKCPEKLKAI